MTRATDALNHALARLAASTCTEPGCNRLAPDPGKACDYHLRINAPHSLKAAWTDPEQWADPQGGGTE